MRLDRIFAAAFVVLVSTAIVGFSAGSTSASFTASTTNPGESWNTSNVAAPASLTATSKPAGQIDLSWPATATPPNGHTVTYLIIRGGSQIASTGSLTYSDTPVADGTYTYTIQTKIAQGAGFFTSGNSGAQSPKSDRTLPTTPGAFTAANGTCCALPYDMKFTWTVATDGGTGVASQTLHWVDMVAAACPAAATTANFPTPVVLGTGVTSYTVTTVAQGHRICGYIDALDNAGNNSAPSAIKSGFTL
jgi:hypothetical protein